MNEQQKARIVEIQAMPGVASASAWKDRIYINIRGSGGSFKGERTTKVFVGAAGLTVERGSGTTSREFDANLKAFAEAFRIAQGGAA